MSSVLTVTKEALPTGKWQVTAVVEDGGTLPKEIFMYSVTSQGGLGEYYGVANAAELSARSIWVGAIVPTFGNAYVRHHTLLREYPDEAAADFAISYTNQRVVALSAELAARVPEVTTFNIP